MRRRLAAVLCGLGLALTAASPGHAAPAVTVSDVNPTLGQVDFALELKDLPTGTDLDRATVTVHTLGNYLPVAVDADGEPDVSATPAEVRSAVVVFDASRSMAEGEALDPAKDAAAAYAASLPGDVLLGLVAVTDEPATLLKPTADRSAFTDALDGIEADGDTALYDGLSAALRVLPEGDRRIVVLSDGRDTASDTSLDDVAGDLAERGVPVDVVALGDEIDRAAVDRVTKASGGRVIDAGDASALAAAFQEAAKSFSARLLVSAQVPDTMAGRTAPMRVEVSVGGVEVSDTVEVSFVALPEREPEPEPEKLTAVPLPAVPSWLAWAVAGVVFVALLMVFLLVTNPVLVGAPRRRRIAQFDRYVSGRPAAAPADVPGAVARTALAWSQQAVRLSNREERMVHKLDRAGMSLRANEWLLIRICVVVTAVVVLWLLLPWWAGIPLGVLAGCVANWLYLRIRTRRRIRKFAEQLPDALQLVIGSLRSGFSLAQALSALVRESADPIATEIGRALAETRLGSELEDALSRVVSRTDSDDLAWAVMSVRIQREVGGNLAEVLQTAVATMRERGQLRRHVKALSAEGRLSAYILIALPIGIFLFLFVTRREYVESLYTTVLGIVMLTVATVLVGIGAFVMSRLVKVEV